MSDQHFDYIITGMGCAGLSLAVQLSNSGLTRGKKILLIDKEVKNLNNRTWCFWETAPGPFESIVFCRWQQAWFHSKQFSKLLDLDPYQYKMIRGIDFYSHCLNVVQSDAAFTLLHADVEKIENDDEGAYCIAGDKMYTCQYLFNSIIFSQPVLDKSEYYLLQHFKGVVINCARPVFNPQQATLMDFRPSQKKGTTFVYVMPFSSTKALVEYTQFSSELLKNEEYDQGLRDYIREVIGIDEWEQIEEEFGVIPMTDYRFKKSHGAIINIGTAGGQTKASSGYTFRFIQKDTAEITRNLQNKLPIAVRHENSRFNWYDSVLLHILSKQKLTGDLVFSTLFRRNEPEEILKFLDNETGILEELKIISSLPQLPFLKAGISELGKLMR